MQAKSVSEHRFFPAGQPPLLASPPPEPLSSANSWAKARCEAGEKLKRESATKNTTWNNLPQDALRLIVRVQRCAHPAQLRGGMLSAADPAPPMVVGTGENSLSRSFQCDCAF
jgi:hypothetical protein